jgi:hypothetical protein
MKNRRVGFLNVLTLACAALLASPMLAGAPPAEEAATTEDILYMEDGRELHGTILEERKDAIVFELVSVESGIQTKITIPIDDISEIVRDVAIEAPKAAPRRTRPASEDEVKPEEQRSFGAFRRAADNPNAPSIYIVPMKGQMGTDVNTDLYEKMIEDIRANDPDILVIQMNCADEQDMLYSMTGREEQGLADFDEYRKLVSLFRDQLGDIRQVLWIEDSVGVSSVVAFVWEDLYMKPQARLGGLQVLQGLGFERWSDEDVRGKMTAAFMSWVKGFLEYGGYSLILADAMVRPQFSLSGTWHGREVKWSLDTSGEYIVDTDDKKTAQFRAKHAEDLCISDGTAEDVDDLALLLGMREYRVCEGRGEEIFEDYTKDWRRSFDQCVEWLKDYQQYQGWVGEDPVKWLGAMKKRLEEVISAMDRYNAVELRLTQDHGVRRFDLITQIEQIKEQLRALKQAERGGDRRGGGGGGLGGGAGGGRGG